MPAPDRFPHGTRARYNSAKCRCAACRRANSDYELARVRRNEPNGIVPADRARAHLISLSERGIGKRSIEDVTGIPNSILAGIKRGDRRNLRQQTEAKILAVDEQAVADHALVDARETINLLRELIAEGFRKTRIAALLGSTAKVPALQFKGDKVLAISAHRIRKLHARLMGEGTEGEDIPLAMTGATPRLRILHAIRFFDWVGAQDLFDAMDVERDDRDRHMQALHRLWKQGDVERRGNTNPYEYRSTP